MSLVTFDRDITVWPEEMPCIYDCFIRPEINSYSTEVKMILKDVLWLLVHSISNIDHLDDSEIWEKKETLIEKYNKNFNKVINFLIWKTIFEVNNLLSIIDITELQEVGDRLFVLIDELE